MVQKLSEQDSRDFSKGVPSGKDEQDFSKDPKG